MYALVSYKVLYSKFTGAKNWEEIGLRPTFKIYLKHLLKDRSLKTFFVVRSPYERTISCFMDKFRKQPARVKEPGFQWQACHKLIYPYCGISEGDSDKVKADRFLQFSFDDFLEILPDIYTFDGHYQPQWWSNNVRIFNRKIFSWTGCTIIKMEDKDALCQIQDIDFSVRANFTNHLNRGFELTERNRKIIQNLYEKDFFIGGYDF